MQTRRIALKVDVDTLRGTLEGVPRLMKVLHESQVGASFYFSVGPDHTGRALKRVFRRGFLGKVRRTSVVEHYGIRTLLYGTLLPGPRIGAKGGEVMRAVRAAGFEVGVHCHDHVRWQDGVAHADAAWTRREFVRAMEAFEGVFGTAPRAHAAAGWQINAQVLDLEHEFGLDYASDSRGTGPFWPTMAGVQGRCVQLPTTLPTLDELIGVDGRDAQGAAEEILRQSRTGGTDTHVFTLHAELEGQRLFAQFEFLLRAWREAGLQLSSLHDYHLSLDGRSIARHELVWGEVPGRSGTLAAQGTAP
ncbi:MAG TPA: polysaccharide deacetylase family protein [Steroidobacteraceae bacterium]|jgi:peptidoglycan/xylan/chitin deacetylase (PgdA/CDA1 family)